MRSSKQKPDYLLLYSVVGVLVVLAVFSIMAAMDVGKDAARVFIWTTVGALGAFAVNMPMFWRFRGYLRFWVVFLAILAVHTAVYLVLLAPFMRQVSVFTFSSLVLPVESALVYLGFHLGLRRQPRVKPTKRT